MEREMGREITSDERHTLEVEFQKRFSKEHQLLDVYRGLGYIENVPGGRRAYAYVIHSNTERPENRWLMLLGAALTFGGLVGFLIEARLRRVKV